VQTSCRFTELGRADLLACAAGIFEFDGDLVGVDAGGTKIVELGPLLRQGDA